MANVSVSLLQKIQDGYFSYSTATPAERAVLLSKPLTHTHDFSVADSSAKLAPGLLWGRSVFNGLFTECRKINEKVSYLDGTTGKIRGSYFR